MKIITFFFAILMLSLTACAQKTAEPNNSANNTSNIPAKLDTTLPWLQIKIWDYQSKPVSNPPRSVIKTIFEGKPVYYVPAVCCDIPSELYAEDGALLCYPSGGFTGAGDGKCSRFKLEYEGVSLNKNKDNKDNKDNKNSIVWQDKRKPAVPTRGIIVLH
jgi:hypothetical protein